MKKFTLILAALLCAFVAKADVTPIYDADTYPSFTLGDAVETADGIVDGYYVLYNVGQSKYVYDAGSSNYLTFAAETSKETVCKISTNGSTDDNGNKLYTIQFYNGYHLNFNSNGSGLYANLEEAQYYYKFVDKISTLGGWNIVNSRTTSFVQSLGYNEKDGVELVFGRGGGSWADKKTGAWKLYPVTLSTSQSVTVTYELYYNEDPETLAASQSVTVPEGASAAENTPFADAVMNATYDPETITSDVTTVVVKGDKNYAAELKAAVNAYFTTSVGGGYFTMTQDYYDANYETYNGYITSGCTKDQYEAMVADVLANLNVPATGYYRMKSFGSSAYYVYYNGTTSNQTGAAVGSGVSTDPSSVLYFEKNDDGTYNISINDQYIQACTGNVQNELGETAEPYTIALGAKGVPGVVCLTSENASSTDGYNYLNCSAGTQGLVGYLAGANNNNSYWTIEDAAETTVELTLTDGGDGNAYATAWMNFPAVVDDAAAVNVISSADEENAYYEAYNQTIPAATPVILKGSAAGTVTATVKAEVETAAPAANLLTGTKKLYAAGELSAYVLAAEDGTIGFYKLSEEASMPANKAYIDSETAGTRNLKLVSADEVTGIQQVTSDKGQVTSIYDLQGRRVNAPENGVFIVNGKKIIK